MCTKKILYSAGGERIVALRGRERGGKLDFTQVAYSVDCVKEIANALDIPMAAAIERIRQVKGAFSSIYREARKMPQRPAKAVAYEVMAL